MTRKTLHHAAARTVAYALLSFMTAMAAGCGLLDVTNPTRLEEDDLANATGADLLRRDAIRLVYEAVGRGALQSGMLADEFFLYAGDDRSIDLRLADEAWAELQPGVPSYDRWQEVRRAASLALQQLRAYAPESRRAAHVGQMFALRGYAALRLGEDICPGFPLHELSGYTPVYGPPLTTEQVFEHALADLDSTLAYAADSVRILDFARVARGRTLLGLGRFAEAAAAVTSVPTDNVLIGEYSDSPSSPRNPLFFGEALFSIQYSVADREGDTGLDFISAHDARVPTTEWLTASDGVTGLYRADVYPSPEAPIVLASGIEARLIEAEAALNEGGNWLGILDELRTTCVDAASCADPVPAGSGGVARLPPLTAPGSFDAQVDLLFRERAFWLFGTGHRLADLRRLIRLYGRSSGTLFPTGQHATGEVYGTMTSLPFATALEHSYSPAVTGCTAS